MLPTRAPSSSACVRACGRVGSAVPSLQARQGKARLAGFAAGLGRPAVVLCCVVLCVSFGCLLLALARR